MKKEIEAFLQNYLVSLPLETREQYHTFDSYNFCADEENANLCADLVLKREKRATAGLLWEYEAEHEPLPEIGQLTVITNWNDQPKCIVETISVEIRSFIEVDAEIAYEEGEGDKSLAHWRAVHWKFFSDSCKMLGKEPDLQMPVVLERFKLVYAKE